MIYKFTNKAKKVIEISNDISVELGHNYIGTEHLLLAILKEEDCVGVRIIMELNVEIAKIYNEIAKVINEEELDREMPRDIAKSKENNSVMPPALKQFGEDITLQAEEGKFDNIIGREKEIERIGRVAFNLAMKRDRKKVTRVDKANVIETSRL